MPLGPGVDTLLGLSRHMLATHGQVGLRQILGLSLSMGDVCSITVGYVDAKNGELARKAHLEFDSIPGFYSIEYCSDAHAVIAVYFGAN